MTVYTNAIGAPVPFSVSVGGTGSTSYSANSIIYSNGTILTQDNSNFTWTDSTYTLNITQPSSLATLESVLVITSDPAGSKGHGNHIEIAGNPGGGGTIFRTDGGLNKSVLQLYGGDSTGTTGGALYLNGNNSTGGDAGGVQSTFGLSTSTFDMYDNTQSILLFQVNNSGVLKLPMLAPNSAIGTDASSNIITIPSNTFTYSVITSNTVLVAGQGYIVNAASPITLTLPLTFAEGSIIKILGYAGGFTVAQNSGQQIVWLNTSTTSGTGGSIASSLPTDSLDLVGFIANDVLIVSGAGGNLTIT
jgi:hypothetical protein